jgi:hypothetical protein
MLLALLSLAAGFVVNVGDKQCMLLYDEFNILDFEVMGEHEHARVNMGFEIYNESSIFLNLTGIKEQKVKMVFPRNAIMCYWSLTGQPLTLSFYLEHREVRNIVVGEDVDDLNFELGEVDYQLANLDREV